jgi:luciferase family oxidoreductase group 1
MRPDPILKRMRLSVLDQSPIAEGSTGSQALQNTIDLARLADALGYTRYWVAEHHGGPMLAGPSPEALIGPIAAATDGIRVGSGGVMLPHYSPFKVAETFSVLAGLFPGRIDLGLGRAAGTDPMTTHALQRDRSRALPDDFPQQLAELLGYFEGTIPVSNPLARLQKILPGRPERPEPWLLGSSPQSAVWAAELGLPYSFADFINPAGAEIAALYRREFKPGARGEDPVQSVAVWAVAADTEEEAIRLASSSRMSFAMLRKGRLIEVPHPDKAVAFLEREGDGLSSRRRAVLGTPEQVRAGIEAAAAEYGAEEVIVVTITWDHEARRRSYELIAAAFGLTPRVEHATPAH